MKSLVAMASTGGVAVITPSCLFNSMYFSKAVRSNRAVLRGRRKAEVNDFEHWRDFGEAFF
jgi:hypothetical protein